MKPIIKDKLAADCEKLVYALVLTLVFEGLLRKMFDALSTPIFFLKDILCVIGVFKIIISDLPSDMMKFRSIWIKVFFLFLPLLLYTASKDVILSVFAVKQYLLYIVSVILVVVAFPADKQENFRIFLFFCSLLLIPTIIVATLQIALPPLHWLNLSVGGESLEGFSSAGKLRVSSTFSFTAQYSYYLIAAAFFLAASFFLQPRFRNLILLKILPFAYFGLTLILVISAFITGGRTAVLGCGVTIALGAIFIGLKRPGWFVGVGLPALFVCATVLTSLRVLRPEYFAAYDARSSGSAEVSHNEEVKGRILSGFTDWTTGILELDATAISIGNGLGIMSNGSAQISNYAAKIRNSGIWTEGDMPTTFWEGGIYFMFLWYGFRLYIMLLCYRLWKAMKNYQFASAASIPFAFVIIQGIFGTIGMQPPVAIWWWLSVGVVFFMYRLEKYQPPVFTTPAVAEYEETDYIH